MTDNKDSFFVKKLWEEKEKQIRTPHSPYYLELELVQRISALDAKGAETILGEINRLQRAMLAFDPLRSLKNSLICSCTLFTRAAITGGASADSAFSLSDICIRIIESCDDIQHLETMEIEMIRQFIDVTKNMNTSGLPCVVRQTIDYVALHFMETLTVESIARGIFVQPSYLSSCFKKETGIPLKTYIQRKRVNESQLMLRRGHDTVAAVANTCQFCSQSHFIQVFKKHTGMTPKQFRYSEGMR